MLIVDNEKHNLKGVNISTVPRISGTDMSTAKPMSVGHRIRTLRIQSGLSQTALGHRVGVRQNTISSWEQNRTRPDPQSVRALARLLSASPAYIEFGLSNENKNPEKVRMKAGGRQRVPLISWVQAGELADIEDPYPRGAGEEVLEISWSHSDIIALRVQGQSMNRLSPEGSIIFVDLRDREPRPGRRYVFKVDGQSTFKTYRLNPERLEPESTDEFDDIPLNGQSYTVVGRVIRTTLEI